MKPHERLVAGAKDTQTMRTERGDYKRIQKLLPGMTQAERIRFLLRFYEANKSDEKLTPA